MPKWMPKWIKNRCDFRTCDFSVLAKSITLKLVFHMTNDAEIDSKSIKNRCQNEVGKKDAKMMEKGGKREPKGSPKSDQNGHKEPKGSQRAGQKIEKAGKKNGKKEG